MRSFYFWLGAAQMSFVGILVVNEAVTGLVVNLVFCAVVASCIAWRYRP